VTYRHVHRGKVRDLYDAGDGRLLMVASDRISAFDVVMAEPIPDKGRVLTAMSAFWFEELAAVAGNHLVSTELASLPVGEREPWRPPRAASRSNTGPAPATKWAGSSTASSVPG